MAIVRETAGAALNNTVATTTQSIPYPATVVANNILIACLSTNGGTATSPASPWVEIFRETGTVSNPRGGVWLKLATGSETGTLDITTTTSVTASGKMLCYSGVDTTTPQDATATSVENVATSATIVLPSITTVTDGAWIIYFGANNSSTTTNTGPGTEQMDFAPDNGGTAGKSGAGYDETIALAGATGTRTITISGARANWGAMLALRPAADAGAGSLAPWLTTL